jgi:hypothetical protein
MLAVKSVEAVAEPEDGVMLGNVDGLPADCRTARSLQLPSRAPEGTCEDVDSLVVAFELDQPLPLGVVQQPLKLIMILDFGLGLREVRIDQVPDHRAVVAVHFAVVETVIRGREDSSRRADEREAPRVAEWPPPM